MIINQTVSGGSSPAPTKKYQLLDRVVDDNNNEIGTVAGFFYDANNIEYALVLLDAQHRATDKKFFSSKTFIPGLTGFTTSNNEGSMYYDFGTATNACDLIVSAGTSTAVNHCRSKSFVIGGVTYYGQLPTIKQWGILCAIDGTRLNNLDPTSSSYASVTISTSSVDRKFWSSSQYPEGDMSSYAWWWNAGYMRGTNKTDNAIAAPILEIPNAI